MSKVAILGAGNGGCAAAVELTLKGFDVALFNRSPERLKVVKKQGGLRYEGAIGEGFCKLGMVSEDIEAVLKNASLIMLSVPGPGHEAYAKLMAPYLKAGDLVLMNPGHSGGALHFAKILKDLNVPQPIKVCETNTLSYISRMVDPGKIKVSSYDKSVLFSVFPSRYLEECVEKVHQFFPAMVPVDNVLITTLSNLNAIFHTPGMVLNTGWIERTEGDFKFYYDGITPAVGRIVDKVDQERLELGKAMGLDLMNFSELLYSVGSTSEEASKANSAYKACQDSEPNKFIMSPPTLDHRYMHEDINSGLLPISCLAKLVGTPSPIIDAIIDISCVLNQRNYWEEGINLKRMGIEGLNTDQLKRFLHDGVVNS